MLWPVSDEDLHGVFITPGTELDAVIRVQKEQVESRMPGQTYCNHPPHATLIAGRYHSVDIWLELLENLRLPQFELMTNGYTIFTDDALAGGGHTVAHRLGPSETLSMAQRTVAEVLEDFVAVDKSDFRFEMEPMKSSQDRFGFPFVGEHWIPHMTIASITGPEDGPLIRELMSDECSAGFNVTQLEVWRVRGDEHHCISRIDLLPC